MPWPGAEGGGHGAAHVASRAEAAGLRAELRAQGGASGRRAEWSGGPRAELQGAWGHGEAAGRVRAKRGQAELRGARGTARRQALGIGIPSARVAGVAEWRDFHTRTKGRGPHRRPRNKRRRAHCSPSFVVRFTTRMTLGTCTATSRCPSAFFPTGDCTRQQVCTHANRVDRQSAREDPRAH